MPPVILLFSKAPVPGRVKTRLQPVLSADQCAELHLSLTEDVIDTLMGFRDSAKIELHLDTHSKAWPDCDFPRLLQQGSDLGQKMRNAAIDALSRGFSPVLLLGSDAPDLPASHISSLLQSSADIAFGPASDGGYWGVLFRAAPAVLFDGVEWSTSQTLAQSMVQAELLGLKVELGPLWQDVDSVEDLHRIAQSAAAPRTRAWLATQEIFTTSAKEGI